MEEQQEFTFMSGLRRRIPGKLENAGRIYIGLKEARFRIRNGFREFWFEGQSERGERIFGWFPSGSISHTFDDFELYHQMNGTDIK
ncbi:MAG: hypothetical protein ABIG08_01205 [bacterium]